MAEELRAINAPPITYIAALNETERHWSAIAEIIAPGGKIGAITNHDSLDATPLRPKSVSVHWEDVVTRMAFGIPSDLIAYRRILEEIASLAETGVLRSTATRELIPINAASIREGHALVEGGRMLGKVVIASSGSRN
jgi:NADPH:quinone reductase-like Zn-dependent oxidoreductase